MTVSRQRNQASTVPRDYNRYTDGAVGRGEVDRLVRRTRFVAIRATIMWTVLVLISAYYLIPLIPFRRLVCSSFCACSTLP